LEKKITLGQNAKRQYYLPTTAAVRVTANVLYDFNPPMVNTVNEQEKERTHRLREKKSGTVKNPSENDGWNIIIIFM